MMTKRPPFSCTLSFQGMATDDTGPGPNHSPDHCFVPYNRKERSVLPAFCKNKTLTLYCHIPYVKMLLSIVTNSSATTLKMDGSRFGSSSSTNISHKKCMLAGHSSPGNESMLKSNSGSGASAQV